MCNISIYIYSYIASSYNICANIILNIKIIYIFKNTVLNLLIIQEFQKLTEIIFSQQEILLIIKLNRYVNFEYANHFHQSDEYSFIKSKII